MYGKCSIEDDVNDKHWNRDKGGVAGPDTPKMQALPEWGGSDPCLDFCEGFVHMH